MPRSHNTVRNTGLSITDRNNNVKTRKTAIFSSYTAPFYRAESHEIVYRANAAVLGLFTVLLRSVYSPVLFDLSGEQEDEE